MISTKMLEHDGRSEGETMLFVQEEKWTNGALSRQETDTTISKKNSSVQVFPVRYIVVFLTRLCSICGNIPLSCRGWHGDTVTTDGTSVVPLKRSCIEETAFVSLTFSDKKQVFIRESNGPSHLFGFRQHWGEGTSDPLIAEISGNSMQFSCLTP